MSFSEVGLMVAYAGLGTMALIPIYLGSLKSVEEAKNTETSEKLGANDAYMFPLIGSAVLFGFYLLFKYFNQDYINLLLTAYFSIFGIYALAGLLHQLFSITLPAKYVNLGQFWVKLLGTKEKPRYQFDLTVPKIAAYGLASALTAYYVLTKHWAASNVLGLAFATSAVSLIHLDSFKTGCILLAGLFVYDVFWVFGTNVMVKVAKSFDVPVKLLFPKNMNFASPSGTEFALLGLGDIVIPGVFIALCRRFDVHLKETKQPLKVSFFLLSFLFYIAGLTTTMLVMHVFQAAQPALLYLSPACIISVLLGGLLNKNLKAVFAYSADEEPVKRSTKKSTATTGSTPSTPSKKSKKKSSAPGTPKTPRRKDASNAASAGLKSTPNKSSTASPRRAARQKTD